MVHSCERKVVDTPCGSIEGNVSKSRDGREFYEWRGIPFGKAPVGPLRFASPQPFGKWEGIRDGSKFGPRCPEANSAFGKVLGSEDCLSLNVSVPNVNNTELLPVMIFIHGGAFQEGTGSMFTPDYFMDEDVVYVNPNYRLGIFGFLSTGDSAIRGNMGLKDQALALRWVKENIQSFGGDPNNITVFGESAGGASVHHLALAPSTKGLFNKVILQSGTASQYWACESTQNAVKYTHNLAKRLNCDTDDTAELTENLRSVSVAKLLAAYEQEITAGVTFRPDEESKFYRPSIEAVNDEEAFLVEHPLKIMAEGRAHRVSWMIGATSHEGLLTSLAFYNNNEVMENFEKNWDNCILWTFGVSTETLKAKNIAAAIKEIYFPNDSAFTKEQKLEQYTTLFSDSLFTLHMSHCISVQSEFSPVYPYYLTRRGGPSLTPFFNFLSSKGNIVIKLAKFMVTSLYNKITGKKPHDYGVCHGDDLAMLFKMANVFNIPKNPQSADYLFSKDMVKLWVDFARDETSMIFRGVKFPKQDPEKPVHYLELCETPKVIEEPFRERADALKSLGVVKARLEIVV